MRYVKVDRRDAVAVLTLFDRERRNAMTMPMVTEIVETFDALEADDDVGAVVVTGNPPAFCSGADTSKLGAYAEADDETERRNIATIYDGFLRVYRSQLPTVAAVNGAAVGAGFNLALACDVRLAATSARFDARFLRLGIHPGGGHTWMLERLVGPQTAAAVVLFGEVMDGPTAATVGLAWRCHADDELVDEAVAFAARAAAVPKPLTARTKATLRQVPWQGGFEAAVTTEVTAQAWSLGQGWFPARWPK
jgi:enoyl-CoA hydratase